MQMSHDALTARAGERPPMVAVDRQRLELERRTIHRMFGVGLKLQAVSTGCSDPAVSSRLDACIRELDLAIYDLRALIVGGSRNV